ncbi:ionic transporter y4hA [Flavihumibacter cheonanensis]|uniref:calcium:proton antiporter n=1 Tax=Flavihumibacter cheonanensis TaxID=1442385 RepID=UPI001EF8FAE9|nr:ionic transporter y4hA [Flavihumibacter cheonanensis]MCG7750852.1 ionic transporter y4hA [Flavihumibacter cheonanensis]
MSVITKVVRRWTEIVPFLSLLLYFLKPTDSPGWYNVVLIGGLISAVLVAVHHAEVVAHKVGEPYGTLVLAIAVTTIEVALIVSLMLAGGPGTETLARDTIFAAIMIILNAITGICLLVGGLRHREQTFGLDGISAALVALLAIAFLTMVLPNFTTTQVGPSYSNSQLLFVGIVTLVIYLSFVFIQTIRHRDYFLPEVGEENSEVHAAPPTTKVFVMSLVLLVLALVAVVLLGKSLSPVIELGIESIGAPKTLVGIIIAMVVLLPEGLAAYRAAKNNRLQNSLNLALGSALASIGLTIPVVAGVSILMGFDLLLGIDSKSSVLLLISLLVVMMSLRTGKTNILQGIILVLLFFVYLFVTIIP